MPPLSPLNGQTQKKQARRQHKYTSPVRDPDFSKEVLTSPLPQRKQACQITGAVFKPIKDYQMSDYTVAELQEMEAEFSAMDAEFAGLGLEEMDSEFGEAFAELDAELDAAGISLLDVEAMSISELADND